MDTPMSSLSPAIHEEPVKNSLPSPSSLLKQAISFFFAHWQIFAGISLLPMLSVVPTLFFSEKTAGGSIGIFILTILGRVLSFVAYIALLVVLSAEGNPEGGIMGAYRTGIGKLGSYVWINIAGFFAMLGGLMLLIVPGLFLALALSFGQYVLMMEGRRGTGGLAYSWYYVQGFWWQILWRLLFFLVIVFLAVAAFAILGAFTFFQAEFARGSQNLPFFDFVLNLLGTGILTPVGLLYEYHIYCALRNIKAEKIPTETQIHSLRRRIRICGWIGTVGIVLAITTFIIVFLRLETGGSGFLTDLEQWIRSGGATSVPSVIFSIIGI
ncbi:MAG: hypothetical protein G01um101466_706 [Parcubacteria group bacterium Gr01-1014_66]|nr:MAG: hypothetical protein G01um101466_706 [Parcubacteria group bacterium Gr01-1014_66]